MDSVLAPHPTAPGLIPSVHVAKDNQRRCLEESRQVLENVDRTYLAQVSGKKMKRMANH